MAPNATAWYQLHGGPDRNATALIPDGALDVVQNFPILGPEESFTTIIGPNLVLTPDGLVGVARNTTTGQCLLIRVTDLTAGRVERVPLDTCHVPWFQGYDPISNNIYLCSLQSGSGPVFQARDARDGTLRWAVRPRDDFGLVDPEVVFFWGCSGAAFDFARREAIVPFLHGKTGLDAWRHRIASINLDTGHVNWATQVPLSSQFTGGVIPTAQPVEGTGIYFIPLSATLTANGIVVTAIVICPDIVTCDVPSVSGSNQLAPFQTAAAWLSRDGLVQGMAYSRMDARSPTLQRDVTSRTAGGAFLASSHGPLAVASLGGNMIIINPESKDWLASAAVSTIEQPEWGVDSLASPVWSDELILAPFYRTLTAFDPVDLSKKWAWATSEPGWLVQDLLASLSGDVFVLVSKSGRSSQLSEGVQGNESMVVRLDGRTGQEVQRLPVFSESWMTTEADLAIPVLNQGFYYPRTPILVPLPDGLGVSDLSGHFARLGLGDPARRPSVVLDNVYPGAGEAVTLSVPAVSAEPLHRVFVRWGDGFLDESTLPEPGGTFIFRHTFGAPQRHQVLVTAVYADGLTGTTTSLIDVGGTAPARLNLLQRAFAPENQNVTFGVLGIILAVMSGLYAGSVRLHRRGRLRREIRATEAVFESTSGTPTSCEGALDARRAAVRKLLLRGKIDEAQAGVLERQVDDLRRALRLQPVHEHIDHLPRGLARRLEKVLEDGHVSQHEHDLFLKELEQDVTLSRAHKARIRRSMDKWRRRDTFADS